MIISETRRPIDEEQNTFSESEKDLKLGAWIAPHDLRLHDATRLAPRSSTHVTVSLPTAAEVAPFMNISLQLGSTRSFLAQLGIEAQEQTVAKVFTALAEKKRSCEFDLINHSLQPIAIDKGTGLFRLGRWSNEVAVGDVLTEMVEKRQLTIDGVKGRDWDYYIDPTTKLPSGLAMKLDPTFRRWLPKITDEIRLTPGINGKEFRHKLDSWLKPIEKDDKPLLEISQTVARLFLPEQIHGLIDKKIETNALHINARRIYGGQTGLPGTEKPWPIRTEMRRADDGKVQPDTIVLTLAKAS